MRVPPTADAGRIADAGPKPAQHRAASNVEQGYLKPNATRQRMSGPAAAAGTIKSPPGNPSRLTYLNEWPTSQHPRR
jgi:hypothetical protein